MALPGLEQSEAYYGKLASGDPAALSRANAPAIQQITNKSNSAKANIIQDNPRGGERNLALEDADITKGAQISQLTTGSYTGAFPSLSSLGGQNVSQGNQATATGLQGENAAANQYGQLQQIQNEQKATQLGFFSSLAGSGAELAGMCWVAIELFGETAYETLLIRRYFLFLEDHWLGQFAFKAYMKWGQRWAEYIKTHLGWRWITLVVFTWLKNRAAGEIPTEERRQLFDLYWASRKDGMNRAG
jgi:hypothetical protein